MRDGYTKQAVEELMSSAGFVVHETRLTFGFFGALASDVEETCRKIHGGLRYLVLPLLALLVAVEVSVANKKRGNALLVIAKVGN